LTVGITHRYQITIVYQQVQAVSSGNQGGISTGGGGGGGIGGGGGGIGGGGGGIGGGGGGIGGGGGGGIGGGGGTTGGIGGGGNTTGGGGNTGNTIIYRETALRATSGGATPIVRPSVTGITDQGRPVDGQSGTAALNNVAIEFQTVAGADKYIFEFSNDPSFKKKVVKGPFFFPSSNTGATSNSFDIRNDLKNVPEGGLIWFRVGARNSVDDPGPLGIDTPNGGDYVYSSGNTTFRVAPSAPNPPQ
jgi:hypothetical protein